MRGSRVFSLMVAWETPPSIDCPIWLSVIRRQKGVMKNGGLNYSFVRRELSSFMIRSQKKIIYAFA